MFGYQGIPFFSAKSGPKPNRRGAERFLSIALAHEDAGRLAEAEQAQLAASRADPDWSVPWYNLGLLCKYQRRWPDSLAFNQRATRLAPDDEAGWWNLGIAATALGNWPEARRAWKAAGFDFPPGEGRPTMEMGHGPVRLDPEGSGEVVWGERLNPTLFRLTSIPLPLSGFRFGDLVLTDGAGAGYRIVGEYKIPVFNVLERLEISPLATFVVELSTPAVQTVESLVALAGELGGAAENWGTSIHVLCRECSLGVVHQHAESERPPGHLPCGIAARDEAHLRAILARWMEQTPGAGFATWTAAPDS